ncbi:hypothetical protein J6500_22605 [Bradyrhizobium sp. WSM 1704]|uniref:hypothetical protein n=1 Tax=Bradyrhizobium semiaridum TaxID=2821404 RepID=UPI001CE348AC|nr:hypothetical protein [Bradyrhizobium semiaridum]MCA6124660.1 hypothetical protein [Bradyrhizobium semiaridum]
MIVTAAAHSSCAAQRLPLGRKDHTTSPSAIKARIVGRAPSRPPHPASNVRDDRDTPLLEEAGCAFCNADFRKLKAEYFLGKDWTGYIALKML